MQPDQTRRVPPPRAMAVYVVLATCVIFAVMVPFARWLMGFGLPWLFGLAGTIAATRLLVWIAAVLSVPAIHEMARRWPSLGRQGVDHG
jgi:hypothetical protein